MVDCVYIYVQQKLDEASFQKNEHVVFQDMAINFYMNAGKISVRLQDSQLFIKYKGNWISDDLIGEYKDIFSEKEMMELKKNTTPTRVRRQCKEIALPIPPEGMCMLSIDTHLFVWFLTYKPILCPNVDDAKEVRVMFSEVLARAVCRQQEAPTGVDVTNREDKAGAMGETMDTLIVPSPQHNNRVSPRTLGGFFAIL